MMKRIVLSFILMTSMVPWLAAQSQVFFEDFNGCAMPTGWSTNIVTGVDDWQFDANGGQNLDGTCMVYFDDDAIGSQAPVSNIELFSPVVDLTPYTVVNFEFDYNFNSIGSDAFDVDVWDGTSWVNVFNRTTDDCGFWGCAPQGSYPSASIDVTPYINANFQIKFRFDDGGVWAWYLGIDNVGLTTPAPNDVGVTEVFVGTCGLTSAEIITVEVQNFGTDTATNISLDLTVDGSFIATEIFAGPIPPGQSAIYTFTATANLAAVGAHTVTASGSVANDASAFNAATTANIFNEGLVNNFPYVENFDAFTACLAGCSNTNCVTAFTTPGWSNVETIDDMNWSVDANGTSSFQTGPSGDHTTGTGNYLYTETSGCNNIVAMAQSPCFDLGVLSAAPDVRVEFWYHMFGATMGTLELQMDTTSTGTWTSLWSLSGNQGDQWTKVTISIAALANGNTVRFRFVGTTGSSFTSDMAIDDFSVYPVFSDDLRIKSFVTPDPELCAYSNAETVTVEVENLGANPATGVQATMFVDGSFIATETVPGTIAPNTTVNYTFTATADLSVPGLHEIEVATGYAADVFTANDSLTQLFGQSLITTYPFVEDFDSWTNCNTTCNDGGCSGSVGTIGWSQVLGESGDWNIQSGSTSSFQTGPTGDHTSGSGKYLFTETSGCTNATITMESGCFAISGLTAPQASFWYHMYGATMGTLQFQIDAGSGFTTVWSLSGNQGDQWSEAVVPLGTYIGQTIRFRWRATTGTSFTSDMAIDDFRVGEAPANDGGISSLLGPAIGGCATLTATETVTVSIVNFGADTLTSADLTLFVNGTQVASETFTGIIPPNDSAIYAFITPVNLTAPGQIIITATAQSLPIDERPWNDTKTFIGFNDGASIVSNYPYEEDFDGFNNCSSFCQDGSCATVGGTTGWRNDTGDNSDWSLQGGATSSFGTGPSFDHTQGAGGTGKYFFTEASGCTNNDFFLTSPCFDFTALQAPELSFWYHMLGTTMGTLRVQVDTAGTGNWITVWSLSGDQGNSWQEAVVDLTPYAGTITKIRFWGRTGTGFNSDMAFDDVLVREVLAHDLQVIGMSGPEDGCGDEQVFVDVKVFNYGFSTETDYSVTVNQTGLTTNSITVNLTTSPLISEDSIVVAVGPFNTALGGPFTFDATVVNNIATDEDPSNDTGTYSYTSFALPYPVGVDSSRCGIGELTVGATGIATQFFWYTNATGGNYIDTGLYYNTPFLNETTTYWVEGRNPFTGNLGPADRFVEEGGYYDFYTDGLVFDAIFDMTLDAVTVYPLFPGDIVVNVEDAQGNLLHQKTFAFGGTVSDTVLTLDFDLPRGNGYRIHAEGSTTEMFRNKDNDNIFKINYPYILSGATRITGAINNLPGSYYFFYNWQVTFLGCPSPRQPVQAIIGPSGLSAVTDSTLETVSGANDGTATVTISGGTGPYTYQWDDPAGQTTAIATGLAGDSTVYNVTVTDANGCRDVFSVTVNTVPVSTNGLEMLENLRVYPNPTTGQFSVDIEMDEAHEVSLEVINILGQVVFNTTPETIAAKRYPINLDKLPSGIYKVRIRIDDQFITRSLMLHAD